MKDRVNEAVWHEKYQRWQINVSRENVRKSFYSSTPGRKGKIEAERKADSWIESQTVDGNTRCHVLIKDYLEQLQTRSGTGHHRQYSHFMKNWVIPVIGNIRIERLTEADLQKVINRAYSTPNQFGRSNSEKTLKDIRGALMAWLKYCRSRRVTTLHPEDPLSIPRGAAKSSKTILQPEALEILFSESTMLYHRARRFDSMIWAYRFEVVTGFRPGEVLGLRKSDVKDNGVYKVSQSINDLSEITSGKNDNANRPGKLSALAQYILHEQEKLQAYYGIRSTYYFTNMDGRPLTQKQFRDGWQRYCKSNGITTGTTPYELRHTFVSVTGDMPEHYKKLLVRHSKNMDTEGTYGHEFKGDLDRAASYIDAAFQPYTAADKPAPIPAK